MMAPVRYDLPEQVVQFILVPLFEKLEKKMPRKAWLLLCYIPAALFALDIVVSLVCKAFAG